MAKAILLHKPDSIYRDILEEKYEFPTSRYLKILERSVGDWIIYYRPGKGPDDQVYFATAKVDRIEASPDDAKRCVAILVPQSFSVFESNVPRISNGKFLESKLLKLDGTPDRGWQQWAVRDVSDLDFHRIIARGFPDIPSDLPRTGDYSPETPKQPGMQDQEVAFDFEDFKRTTVEVTLNRKVRDRAFRHRVLDAYERRCAFTGLQLINGGGRAEAEAAHIQPVEADGPDSIRNGIALSGTVHWMFDRGLLSLSNDLSIMVSRHVNNPNDVHRVLGGRTTASSPTKPEYAPHPKYLEWHRANCFKT
jgi:putative restriction endonuclease